MPRSVGTSGTLGRPAPSRAWPLVLLLALILSAGCHRSPPLVERQFFAMGTLVTVSVYGTPQARAERAIARSERLFDRLDRRWHAWHPSALTRMDAALAAGRSIPIPPDLARLVREAGRLSRLSDGLFDPALGQLLALWGFEGDDLPARPPPAASIQQLLARHPSMSDLVLEEGRIRSRNPAVRLDFGAYAKGVAVDRAIDLLRSLGIRNAIVNAGGDLRAIGRHGARAWRIGIRNPDGPGVIAWLEVEGDQAVFTSGDYERYFSWHGKRYHHILDPRTGYPARGSRSVTVLAKHGGLADAAATALFVAGPDGWYPIARALGIHYVMLVDDHGRVHMNPRMARRIHFPAGRTPEVKLSPAL